MLRRQVLAMLGGLPVMAGDQLRRPMNAPSGQQAPPGIQPGSNGITVTNRLIVAGPNGGAFFYSGAPAFGNLIDSVTRASGTDPYGNAYLNGHTSYTPGVSAVSMNGTVISWYTTSSAAGPYTLLYSLENDIATDNLLLVGGGFESNGGTVSTPSSLVTDIWNAVSPAGAVQYAGNWTDHGADQLQYQLMPFMGGAVALLGRVFTTVATAGVSAITTALPAAYRPKVNTPFTAVEAGAPSVAHRMTLVSTGVIQIQESVGANNDLNICAIVPLTTT